MQTILKVVPESHYKAKDCIHYEIETNGNERK